MSVYRDLVKHSSVYGLGLALSRVASVLLLPFYTRFLTPADYGIVAILDLTSAIVSHLAAGGVHVAVLRHHYDSRYAESRHDLWTTGLAMLGAIAVPQLLVVWWVRAPLADLVLGGDIAQGAAYLGLAIVTLPARLFSTYSQAYLRAEKRSSLFVAITVSGLLLRIALNIWFIGFRGMGVFGFLWGSLLGGWAESLAYAVVLFAGKPFRILREVVGPMWQYGWPLILTTLSGLAMHQMDRYLLRWLLDDLGPIGIYSVAYTLAQGVNSLVVVPFHSIWEAVTYEIDALPERVEVFRRVFKYFVVAIALVLLAVALLSVPLVRILAAPEFAEAADVLPWLCLAFLFFPLHSLLRVPAMIHRRTTSVARTSMLAAAVNFVANLALIPRLGIYGAAVASVITYAMFSLMGHLAYRQIENLHFPIQFAVYAAVGGAALVVAERLLVPGDAPLVVQIAVGVMGWCLAAGVVIAGPARGLVQRDSVVRRALARVRGATAG